MQRVNCFARGFAARQRTHGAPRRATTCFQVPSPDNDLNPGRIWNPCANLRSSSSRVDDDGACAIECMRLDRGFRIRFVPVECRDGNYEGTITADFREYIFDGTIKWLMNYIGGECWDENGRERDRGHVATIRVVYHCGEIYYSAGQDWLPDCTYPGRNFNARYQGTIARCCLMGNAKTAKPVKLVDALRYEVLGNAIT